MTEARLETVLIAIADRTRRAILERLSRGPSRVTDLAAPFDMSLNAVSKHIKVLEHAGLVRRSQRGREHTLELDAAPLRDVAQWVSHYERFWAQQLDRIEDYFKRKRKS